MHELFSCNIIKIDDNKGKGNNGDFGPYLNIFYKLAIAGTIIYLVIKSQCPNGISIYKKLKN